MFQQTHDYERGGTQKDSYEESEVIDVPCPMCGGTERTRLYEEYEILGIVRCGRCDLIYTSPRLREPEKIYWGERDDYYAEAKLIFQGKRRHHRDPNYLEELRLIERFAPKGRLLDVGCNMGMLLRLARDRGWEAVGVEPSPSLASLAVEELGLQVHQCFLNEVPDRLDKTFDVVTLSDVFEHVSDPLDMLGQARRLLKPGGTLYVKVPNAKWSILKQRVVGLLGRRPRQGIWDSYEHVVHYTDRTLRAMLAKAGFEVLTLRLARPVQIPVWHLHVGHYYQYPSPFSLDWKRYAMRALLHRAGFLERALRFGSVGLLPPSLAVMAR